MPVIKTVGIIAKPRSDLAARIVPEMVRWLAGRGVGVRLDPESAGYADSGPGLAREILPDGAQLVIVLGGDGTLLSAARAIAGRDIPLLAVNLGGLGFLTAITVDQIYPQLERALHGDFPVSRHRMLHCELWREGTQLASYEALNDLVLTKAEIARMIDLEVQIDGHFVCVYKADGLIVATPTGSTAYSLSAGGPIMVPDVAAFAITPICPHTLTNRPLVVPDQSVIQVLNRSDDEVTYLTIDGQVGELLKHDDSVICKSSTQTVGLIRPPEKVFFDVLREKLHWGGR
jgi:NAD+ kinase